MSIPRVLPIVLATLGGVAIGWVIRPSTSHADAARETNGPVLKRETRHAGNENPNIATRWIDKMRTGDVKAVAKEVPAGEIKEVMDGLMAGVWGSLSKEQITQMEQLIRAWAEKDPKAALAWARNLRHPRQRELGLSFVAAAVAEKDPRAGFEIYAEMDKVMIRELNEKVHGVISGAYDHAAKEGPASLLELMRRTPESDGFGFGIHPSYPQGFDFTAMMDGMAKAGYFGPGGTRTSKPFVIGSPLAEWALRDREAAFSYLAANAGKDSRHRLDDLTDKLTATHGNTQTNAWLGDKLASLTSEQRRQLAKGTLAGSSAEYLNRYIHLMPTEEAAVEFRYDLLQATAESGWEPALEILNEMPEIEDRLALVGRLHGVTDTDGMAEQLRKWNVPQERIDTIVEKVKRKE